MKKIYILFLCLMATFIITSCENFITEKSEIYVYDSEHGSIEVKHISSTSLSSRYEIVPYPDEGYCLEKDNIKIFIHSEDFSESNRYSSNHDYGYSIILEYDSEVGERFIFDLYHPINISISAFFTKIEE